MENFNLTQTGAQVQEILDKAALLPNSVLLEEKFEGKQDVIPDLLQIRQNAQLGAEAYSDVQLAEQQAAEAAQSAGVAQQKADEAAASALDAQRTAGQVNDALQTLIEDTQHIDAAVAAQVAQNTSDIENLEQDKADKVGSYEGLNAGNLTSWEGSTQNASHTQEDVVETTGGDLSIDSSVPAELMSIVAKTDFAATALVATGFNLLRRATSVGSGFYFLVPALPYGAINTATQPNGILFTNSQGVNLTPTVYFKPLSGGVPTSTTDGTACTYTNAVSGGKSYRFYTTAQAGYIIVSGIDRATTCAHIGWSKRYDEYIAVNDPNDAGSEVDIAAGIHALHTFDKMLVAGGVSDRIENAGSGTIRWHRLVDRVQPTWANTPVVSDGVATGDYLHTATISGMKAGGAAEFETLSVALTVADTTISFIDDNASVETDYVKYELAVEATGTASISSQFAVEDWGLIIIAGAVGQADINIAYAQSIPDSVRQMLAGQQGLIDIIAAQDVEIDGLAQALIDAQNVDQDMKYGQPRILWGNGVPAEETLPTNWRQFLDGGNNWIGKPAFVGQLYINTAVESGGMYIGYLTSGSLLEWRTVVA